LNISKAVAIAAVFLGAGLVNQVQAAPAGGALDFQKYTQTGPYAVSKTASVVTEGLGMNYTKIVVGNLPVGCTVSMQTIANLPLKVKSNYSYPILADLQIAKSDKAIGEYQSIPDPAWIKIEPASVTVAAHGTSIADVLISIPNDEKYFGKKYIAEVSVATLGNLEAKGISFGYSVTGYLMFGVAPGRNLEGLKQVINQPIDAAYTIFPPRIDVYGVVPGTLVKVSGPDKKPVELTNDSKHAGVYNLKSVDPATTDFQPDSNARFTGVTGQVVLAKTQYRIKSGKRVGLDVKVQVPADADLAKGPLIYLVAITGGARQNVVQYLKIYLWDKKPGERTVASTSNTQTVAGAVSNTLSVVSAGSNTPAAMNGK
jgi:hypothetical protein